MNEEWRDIVGYEGLYQVSNLGRIKNIRTPVCSDRGNDLTEICLVKPSLQKLKRNYFRYRVNLWKENKPKTFKVHRLVATAFILNPLNKPQVNHIDNNPLNNNVKNLEWCTILENMEHSKKQGRMNVGRKNGMNKFSEQTIQQILLSKENKSLLSKKYNISISYINSLKRGTNWKHLHRP